MSKPAYKTNKKSYNSGNTGKPDNPGKDRKVSPTPGSYTPRDNKFVVNESIQNNKLYGPTIYENCAKMHLTPEITAAIINGEDITIKGEEHMGKPHRICIGGIIIAPAHIGYAIEHEFNERQHQHIKNRTFAHKILCQQNDEASALLFLTLYDLLGEKFDTYLEDKSNFLDTEEHRRDLCYSIQTNIQDIVEDRLSWMVNYSKHILRDYYSLTSKRLKIKLNFILDDGKHGTQGSSDGGGLLLNGLLARLEEYSNDLNIKNGEEYEPIGILCQVLCPSGLPKNKKWIQIDVGISFGGKRQFQETLGDAMIRECIEEIHLKFHDDILRDSELPRYLSPKLYYGGTSDGLGYEGYEVRIIEIFYDDQVILVDEQELNYKFCKCKERTKIIEDHKKIIYPK